LAYKLDMKIKQYRHLSIFLAIYWNLYGNMVIWKTNSWNMVNLGHFFHWKSFVWVQIILFRLKTIKFHPQKIKMIPSQYSFVYLSISFWHTHQRFGRKQKGHKYQPMWWWLLHVENLAIFPQERRHPGNLASLTSFEEGIWRTCTMDENMKNFVQLP
jgi:hypothetical protein